MIANGERKIRLLIAEEQSLFREAVRVVLERESDIEVVAEARDGLQAVAAARQTQPDVAIVDAGLPNGDGFRVTALMKSSVPGCKVLVVSAEEEERSLVAAFEAGASGYLTKTSPLAELISATRAIHDGDTLVPPRMLGTLIARLTRRRTEQDEALRRASRLTRREREVLALLAEGADNDAIAQALVISPQTARTHVQNVLGKLGVHSRLEAAAFVRQNRIVEELVGSDR
jgi:DNA-binding NarL/FixJ family response regulator